MAATKTTQEQMVALGDILGRIGGDEARVRRMVSEVGGRIEKRWDGDDSVTATIAGRVVALHDKQHAESEAFATGYQRTARNTTVKSTRSGRRPTMLLTRSSSRRSGPSSQKISS